MTSESSVVEQRTAAGGRNEELAALVKAAAGEAGIELSSLAACVIGNGPGSFTGLRIGFSFLKGLALALQKPLFSISSLLGYALEFRQQARVICALSDARRGECFCAVYMFNDKSGLPQELRAPCIVGRESVGGLLDRYQREHELSVDDVLICQVHSCLEASLPYRVERPQHVARSLAYAASASISGDLLFSIDSLAALTPQYIRAVAAKTIVEREAEKEGKQF